MERHILDTLSWDVYEPMINDYVLNVDENCLIQYELYKRQLDHNKDWCEKRQSQASHDSDATVDERIVEDEEENLYEEDEDEDLNTKIQLINLKRFLIDLSAWQYDLLKYEMFEVSHGIFSIINRFTNGDHCRFLMAPYPTTTNQAQLLNIFINAVAKAPGSLIEVYKEKLGIMEFIASVKEYQVELHKKLQLASAMDLSRRRAVNASHYFEKGHTIPSPTYSQHYTPMRNTSTQSDNSVFSTMDQSSPITPQMYSFSQYANDSACASSLSVNSIPNKNSDNDSILAFNSSNKENHMPAAHQMPPRAKFLNNGMFASPNGTINSGNSSNRSSLVSLAIANVNSMV